MTRGKCIRFVAVVLGMALVAGPASGALVDGPHSVAYNATTVPDAGTIVQLPQFDEATLGTLLSITLELDATAFAGTITWDNESAIPTDVTLGIGAQVTAAAPSSLTLVATPLQTGNKDGVDPDNDAVADFIGTDSFSVTGGTGNDTDTDVLTNHADFAPYIGVGLFDVDISSIVKTMILTSGGSGEDQHTAGQASGTVKVTYTYLPEPATLALMGLGLASVVTMKRRK